MTASVGAHLRLVLGEVAPQLGAELVEVGEERVEVPVGVSSLAAVFSPTPGTPGRLSDGSPRRAASSGYSSGPAPVRSRIPASSYSE